jgi:hypothetical protein
MLQSVSFEFILKLYFRFQADLNRDSPTQCAYFSLKDFFLREQFEHRVSSLLGRYSSTCAIPPALFCFSYFSNRVLNCLFSLA